MRLWSLAFGRFGRTAATRKPMWSDRRPASETPAKAAQEGTSEQDS